MDNQIAAAEGVLPAVAVYGAAGHTGRFVVRELLRRGFAVIAIGRDEARLATSPPLRRSRPTRPDARRKHSSSRSKCAKGARCAEPRPADETYTPSPRLWWSKRSRGS